MYLLWNYFSIFQESICCKSTFPIFRNIFVVKVLFYFSRTYLLWKYFSIFQEHICWESTFLFFRNIFFMKILFYFKEHIFYESTFLFFRNILLWKYFSIFRNIFVVKVFFYFSRFPSCLIPIRIPWESWEEILNEPEVASDIDWKHPQPELTKHI